MRATNTTISATPVANPIATGRIVDTAESKKRIAFKFGPLPIQCTGFQTLKGEALLSDVSLIEKLFSSRNYKSESHCRHFRNAVKTSICSNCVLARYRKTDIIFRFKLYRIP